MAFGVGIEAFEASDEQDAKTGEMAAKVEADTDREKASECEGSTYVGFIFVFSRGVSMAKPILAARSS